MSMTVLHPENKALENSQVQHELVRRLVEMAQTPLRPDQTPAEKVAELKTISDLIVTNDT